MSEQTSAGWGDLGTNIIKTVHRLSLANSPKTQIRETLQRENISAA
jgi:hypothetical protein